MPAYLVRMTDGLAGTGLRFGPDQKSTGHMEENDMRWSHLLLGLVVVFACIWASNNISFIKQIVG